MTRFGSIALWLVAAALAFGGFLLWRGDSAQWASDAFARGNGRIEAVEIDVAATRPGRVGRIMVREGELVAADEPLAELDTRQLRAARHQAVAEHQRAGIAVENARLLVTQRAAEVRAAEAVLAERRSTEIVARRQLERSEALAEGNITSERVLELDRAAAFGAAAAVASAEAALAAAQAGVTSAEASVVSAEAAVIAAQAAIDEIDVQIEDSTLTAPRAGRVQFIVAREGEVVGGGGRVVNMVDLGDVYMTFFLPTAAVGRIGLGSEVRLLLDAAPGIVIPAEVSFVSDVAQFTPKTVETEVEREKLMFRVRARIAPELLAKYADYAKTGLPGVAWVRLDPEAPWPAAAEGRVLE